MYTIHLFPQFFSSSHNCYLTSGSAGTRHLYLPKTMFIVLNCFNRINFSESGTACGKTFILKANLTEIYTMLIFKTKKKIIDSISIKKKKSRLLEAQSQTLKDQNWVYN